MINKKNIWFLTLFSLILVLSVYYITMPTELLLTNEEINKEKEVSTDVSESNILVALRVESDEEMMQEIDNLTGILTKKEASTEEKNNAFERIKGLNIIRGEEEAIEKKILNEHQLKSFVKVNGDQVKVVVLSEKHDEALANKIMRTVQNNYKNKMYITVNFKNE